MAENARRRTPRPAWAGGPCRTAFRPGPAGRMRAQGPGGGFRHGATREPSPWSASNAAPKPGGCGSVTADPGLDAAPTGLEARPGDHRGRPDTPLAAPSSTCGGARGRDRNLRLLRVPGRHRGPRPRRRLSDGPSGPPRVPRRGTNGPVRQDHRRPRGPPPPVDADGDRSGGNAVHDHIDRPRCRFHRCPSRWAPRTVRPGHRPAARLVCPDSRAAGHSPRALGRTAR